MAALWLIHVDIVEAVPLAARSAVPFSIQHASGSLQIDCVNWKTFIGSTCVAV